MPKIPPPPPFKPYSLITSTRTLFRPHRPQHLFFNNNSSSPSFASTLLPPMAAWGGLAALFENPKPKNPTLIESLSPWNQIMPKKPPEEAAGFTEIFGELHFQEKLHLCTERLGSESSDNVDRLTTKELEESGNGLNSREQPKSKVTAHGGNCSAARARTGVFPPPPISSARRSGKSWTYFKSCREDGRLVLRKVTVPTQELLHASRGEGRLKLHLVLPDEATPKEGEEHEEQEETIAEEAVEETPAPIFK